MKRNDGFAFSTLTLLISMIIGFVIIWLFNSTSTLNNFSTNTIESTKEYYQSLSGLEFVNQYITDNDIHNLDTVIFVNESPVTILIIEQDSCSFLVTSSSGDRSTMFSVGCILDSVEVNLDTLALYNDDPKITICHNPDKPSAKTLNVNKKSLKAHFKHGDYIGTCEDGEDGNNIGYETEIIDWKIIDGTYREI